MYIPCAALAAAAAAALNPRRRAKQKEQSGASPLFPEVMTYAACFVVFGFLIVRVVAGCECVKLTKCASCIVGRDDYTYPLQLMQKPEFFPPPQQQGLGYDFRKFPAQPFSCNISCQWNQNNKSCSDFSVRHSPPDDKNFVYPVGLLPDGQPDESSRFDIYSRMGESRNCNDPYG